jgi:hypothetical protein
VNMEEVTSALGHGRRDAWSNVSAWEGSEIKKKKEKKKKRPGERECNYCVKAAI